jgi:anion-transporting  ArsA/GET3 family ATPase
VLKFLKNLFGRKSTPEFSVEMRSSPQEKTKWDEVSEMEIPSSEKIKLVKIQEIPVEDGQILEAKRKSKKYTITAIPQAPDCFEHDESKKITLYVLAGSKEEALETLSNKLSGKYPFYGDSNTNNAIAGRWYDGNRYLLEITHFEKVTKST